MLSGTIGIGGGLIFVPIFDHIAGHLGITGAELVKFTLANSFFCIFISGIITSYRQIKNDNFFGREILFTAIPALITASLLSYLITSQSWYSEQAFKLLFIGLLFYTVVKTFISNKNASEKSEEHSVIKFVFIGSLTGLASGLSGLGGGVIMIPLFRNLLYMDMKKASSVSIGVIPVLLFPVLAIYFAGKPDLTYFSSEVYHWGYLLPFFVAPVTVGLWFGSYSGIYLSQKMTNRHLQLIFAVLLSILIIKYITELFI